MDHLSDLEVFVEVVELGDFSKAARALGVMPSSVSRAIQRLEKRLGSRLLDRRTGFMRPTAEGEALYDGAKPALAAIMEAEAQVAGALGAAAGPLRVQAVPTFGLQHLVPLAAAFRQLHPQIQLELLLESEVKDVVTHRIDVTISTGLPQSPALLSNKLGETFRVMCASPDYLARKGTPRSVEDLARHDHLGFVLSSDYRPNNDKGASLGGYNANLYGADRFGSVISSNNGVALRLLCLHGLGIARLSNSYVKDDLASGRLVELFPAETRENQNVYAIYPRHLRASARVRAFVDFLQANLKLS
ncbi:MAG TPA: LysR family transcriptional regulator [Caulobacteraceae bacterium]|nr:LysR family transcriptional regulator [Caulobacteraceae bacterium]